MSKNNLVNLSLVDAAEKGSFSEIKDLLINQKADIHFNDDNTIRALAKNAHWEMVKYVLQSSELKEHADIHAKFDEVLRKVVEQNNFEMFKWCLQNYDSFNEWVVRTTVDENRLEMFKYILVSPESKYHAYIRLFTGGRGASEPNLVCYVASNYRFGKNPEKAFPYLDFLLLEYKNPKTDKYYSFPFPNHFLSSDNYPNIIKKHVSECIEKRKAFVHDSFMDKFIEFFAQSYLRF